MLRCEWGMIDIIFFFPSHIRNCTNMAIHHFFNILCSMVFFTTSHMTLSYHLLKMHAYNLPLEKAVNIPIFIQPKGGGIMHYYSLTPYNVYEDMTLIRQLTAGDAYRTIITTSSPTSRKIRIDAYCSINV